MSEVTWKSSKRAPSLFTHPAGRMADKESHDGKYLKEMANG